MEHKPFCLLKRAQIFLPVKKKAKTSKFEIICTARPLPSPNNLPYSCRLGHDNWSAPNNNLFDMFGNYLPTQHSITSYFL